MSEVVVADAPKLPAHISSMFGAFQPNEDLSTGVSQGFPILSIKGKVWHLVQGEQRDLIEDPATGDPKSSIEVVILKANPKISKIYYPGGYTEGSSEKPTCYSHDGATPAVDVVERQAIKCAVCPHNQWGSRITENGAKGKECTDSRRLAVAPLGELDRPMLLRVPAATLKELLAYADLLNRRRTPYQAVVTRIGFDHTVAHQKLTFRALRYLSEDEAKTVLESMALDVIGSIIGDSGGVPEAEAAPAPAAIARVAVTPEVVAKAVAPAPAPVEEPGLFDEPEEAPAPKPVVKKASAKKPEVVQADVTSDLDEVLKGLDFDD